MPIVGTKGYIAGGPQLAARLAQLSKAASDTALVRATSAGAEVIRDEWKQQAQSRLGKGPGSGHYVDAIGYRASPGDHGATAYVGLTEDVPLEPGEDHPRAYAKTLEFGRQNHPAKPTLRPSFDAAKGRALEAMANVLRNLLGM